MQHKENHAKRWLREIARRLFTREVAGFLGASLVASTVIAVAAMYLSTIGYAEGLFASYFVNPVTLIFNIIPVFLFVTLLALLFQSLRLSVALNGFFWCLLSVANLLKLSYRHANLKPEDFSLIMPTLKILPHYIGDFDLKLLLPVGLGALAIVLFALRMPKIRFRLASRLGAALVLVAIASLTVTTVYANTPIYKNQYFINESRWCDTNGITYRLHSDRYQANGVVYSFLYNSRDVIGPSDEHYDAANAERLYEQYGDEPIPEDEKVHVVTILLESYKDFSPENVGSTITWTDGQNPYTPMHEIQKESLSGTMISDVYGGGTIHIETGVLSGLYKQPNYINHPGYTNVHYFHDNGYQTIAAHPNDGYFYSRHDRYPNEGFQNFLYTQNHFKNDLNTYMKDDVFFKDLKEIFDRYRPNGPVFLYGATMQGHGPYNSDSLDGREWFANTTGGSQRAHLMMNNYFQTIYETGTALQDLLDSFNEEDEPVVVIAFGDHNPRPESGAMSLIGVGENDGTVEGKLNNYGTPYIIWGNDAAKARFAKNFRGELPTIDPQQMIANVLFNYLGWHGNAYHAFLQDFGKSITSQKTDFWTVDGVDTVIYPEEHMQQLQDLTDFNIFYRKMKVQKVEQIDERSDDKRYESDSPAIADPDSSENAATKALTGNAKGR